MRIAVTGHRPSKLGNEYDYNGPYSKFIDSQLRNLLTEYQPSQGISGMALGVDTIFALICLEMKIPLLAALPFEGQESKWPLKSQKKYYEILNNQLTTTVMVCEPGYDPEKMQIRNAYMVDNCDLLLAVYNGTRGGTFNCMDYARKRGKTTIIINPEDWRKVEAPKQPSLF